MSKPRLRKQNNSFDKRLLFLTLLLTFLGLIAIADASAPSALSTFGDRYYFVKQQAVWGLLGVLLMGVVSQIHYSVWKRLAVPLFVLGILMLIAVLVPALGARTLGAKRWLILGPISLQPAEFVKLSFAIYIASLKVREKRIIAYLLPLIIVTGLIMLQPDLGSTIVILAIGMTQIFVSGVNLISFFGIGAGGAVLGFLMILLSDYRRDRLLTFFEIARDPLGKSYHIRQILFGLGSGGLLGVGLGQSRQKYLFLPEVASDSIFAVVAEELGFLGATILIILFVLLIVRGLKIAKRAPDEFSNILAVGIISWIGIQALLNIGSMVALIPLTGIPLPFFSYGGSALIMALIAIGILLNISKYGAKARK